jgi:Flp pilus assembly pilin Flp
MSTSRQRESGASAVEYALLVSSIAAVILLVVFAVGRFVQAEYDTTCDALDQTPQTTIAAAATCP